MAQRAVDFLQGDNDTIDAAMRRFEGSREKCDELIELAEALARIEQLNDVDLASRITKRDWIERYDLPGSSKKRSAKGKQGGGKGPRRPQKR